MQYLYALCFYLLIGFSAVNALAGTVLDGETGLPIKDVLIHYKYSTSIPSPGGAVGVGEGG